MAGTQNSEVGVWQALLDHAAAFSAAEADDAELIDKPDVQEPYTRARFIRVDEKLNYDLVPNRQRGTLTPAKPYSASASTTNGEKWDQYAFLVRRPVAPDGSACGLFVDMQSLQLKNIARFVFWETQYSPHFTNYQ